MQILLYVFAFCAPMIFHLTDRPAEKLNFSLNPLTNRFRWERLKNIF